MASARERVLTMSQVGVLGPEIAAMLDIPYSEVVEALEGVEIPALPGGGVVERAVVTLAPPWLVHQHAVVWRQGDMVTLALRIEIDPLAFTKLNQEWEKGEITEAEYEAIQQGWQYVCTLPARFCPAGDTSLLVGMQAVPLTANGDLTLTGLVQGPVILISTYVGAP